MPVLLSVTKELDLLCLFYFFRVVKDRPTLAGI